MCSDQGLAAAETMKPPGSSSAVVYEVHHENFMVLNDGEIVLGILPLQVPIVMVAVPMEWQTGKVVPILTKVTRLCFPNTGGSHSSAFLGRCLCSGQESSSVILWIQE